MTNGATKNRPTLFQWAGKTHIKEKEKKTRQTKKKRRQNSLKKEKEKKFKVNFKEKDQHTMLYFGKIFRRQLDTGKR